VDKPWNHPRRAKALHSRGQGAAWWYGDRDGITVVVNNRSETGVVTLQARLTRKQLATYMREVKGRVRRAAKE
jgi:hypothetical protein